MTNAPVNASASSGDEKTYWNATRYICVGSAAFSGGIRFWIARNARNEPASILSTPGTIQPGPADSEAAHQRHPGFASRAGRKRRKSTCSPICAISEKTTVEAVPNSRRLNVAPLDSAVPRNCVHSPNERGA